MNVRARERNCWLMRRRAPIAGEERRRGLVFEGGGGGVGEDIWWLMSWCRVLSEWPRGGGNS